MVYVSSQENEKYPIDSEGKVYLYGLKPDQYNLLIKTEGGASCTTRLDIVNTTQKSTDSQLFNLVCR